MSLRIETLREQEEKMQKQGKFYISDRRLYHNRTRDKVVEEGDPEAAFLYAAVGHRIPIEYAEEHGLIPKPKKAAPKSKNKAAPKSPNKSEG